MAPNRFWSERMVFGAIILIGFITLQAVLAFSNLPSANMQLLSQGVGALSAAVGLIAAASFKNDSTDKSNAQTMATLATAAANSPAVVPPLVHDADTAIITEVKE